MQPLSEEHMRRKDLQHGQEGPPASGSSGLGPDAHPIVALPQLLRSPGGVQRMVRSKALGPRRSAAGLSLDCPSGCKTTESVHRGLASRGRIAREMGRDIQLARAALRKLRASCAGCSLCMGAQAWNKGADSCSCCVRMPLEKALYANTYELRIQAPRKRCLPFAGNSKK